MSGIWRKQSNVCGLCESLGICLYSEKLSQKSWKGKSPVAERSWFRMNRWCGNWVKCTLLCSFKRQPRMDKLSTEHCNPLAQLQVPIPSFSTHHFFSPSNSKFCSITLSTCLVTNLLHEFNDYAVAFQVYWNLHSHQTPWPMQIAWQVKGAWSLINHNKPFF